MIIDKGLTVVPYIPIPELLKDDILTRGVLNSPLGITSPATPTVPHDMALLATPIGVVSLGEPVLQTPSAWHYLQLLHPLGHLLS